MLVGLDTELSLDGAHSSWNIVSTKWALAYLNGDGFVAIRIILLFHTPVIGGRNEMMLVQPWPS